MVIGYKEVGDQYLMLAFGFIVIYVKFVAPLFGLPIPPLENEFWNLLQLGIGGYVVGRSAEKDSW